MSAYLTTHTKGTPSIGTLGSDDKLMDGDGDGCVGRRHTSWDNGTERLKQLTCLFRRGGGVTFLERCQRQTIIASPY